MTETLFNTYPVVIENVRKALRQHGHDQEPVEVMEQLLTSAWHACNYYADKYALDALLYLIDKYGMDAQNAVMIGDRDCDLGSARNANIRSAHYVCYGAGKLDM